MLHPEADYIFSLRVSVDTKLASKYIYFRKVLYVQIE